MEVRGDRGIQSPRKNGVPRYKNTGLPRSASYTYIKDLTYLAPSVVTIRGDLPDIDSLAPVDESNDISPVDSSGHTTPDQSLENLPHQLHTISPPVSRRSSKEQDEEDSSLDSSAERTSLTSLESTGTTSTTATSTNLSRPRPSLNSSYSRLTRRSWCNSTPSTTSDSRSPSPTKDVPSKRTEAPSSLVEAPTKPVLAHARKKSLIRKHSFGFSKDGGSSTKVAPAAPELAEVHETPSRRPSLLKMKPRPVSGIFRSSSKIVKHRAPPAAVPTSTTPTIPTSFSTDKLPVYNTSLHERAAPVPRLLSSDRVPTINTLPRKKDELWGVFRSLDGDFAKFSSKSTSFKANIVRSSLLPFLRTYATHASNENLRLEDLDRRANILNKWWTGLIDVLHGRNNQLVSGMDRPAILDGLSGIMQRCEWRMAQSPSGALQHQGRVISTPKSQSSTGSSNDILVDSVYQNVRNIFVQNLTAQMAVVVDKMSLRHAPASLVAFCGKACAYAFMFVPGMAEVLIRLWDTQLAVLQRVLSEVGVGKFDNLTMSSTRIAECFPPTLRSLGFSSLKKFMRKLRTPPPLPPGTANIEWWGQWLDRWSGRESDLFYVFVKHFHILVADFIPLACTRIERVCAPGMLAVHAQILANLDATMHRDANTTQHEPTISGSASTFDDLLADPDAVASALPIPPTNAIRVMAENRLIMLIRDFLSERVTAHGVARRMFAESFTCLLHAAAKGISVFDHAACYTLLDFLEEALTILARYEIKHHVDNLVDPEFWQAVCKKIVSSQNTITEIRLYSFLYTVWGTLASDSNRKANLCLNFLLEPEVFEASFNHWCPMVRAYYMRLLCWRVGRFDGDEAFGDEIILETLLERLQTSWGYYLHLKEQAMTNNTTLPACSPCNPAPSRRLLIIRTDTQPRGGALSSFESLLATGPGGAPMNALPDDFDSRPSTGQSTSDSEAGDWRDKGFGGLLRKVMAGLPKDLLRASTSNSQNRSAPIHTTGREQTDTTPEWAKHANHTSSTIHRPHHHFCFKFSLEYHPHHRTTFNASRLQAPRLPLPAQLFLQTRSVRARAVTSVIAAEPRGASRDRARYAGRALAEWNLVLGECHAFFERRKHEGVPGNHSVETPTLGVEVFRRPT